MKKYVIRTFLVMFVVCFNFSAMAAKPSSSTLSSVIEVINLPAENRTMLVQGKQGEKLYPKFIEVAFSDEQPMSLRWKALMTAAKVKQVAATGDLLKAGKHSQWFMRNAALVALAEVNPAQAEQLAIKLLKDKALVVRSAAVDALTKSSSQRSRDLLWDELNQKYNFQKNQSLWIRSQIVTSLAVRPKDQELKQFAKLLSDADQRVHAPAVKGLERLTGVRLGEGKVKSAALVALWKNYLKNEVIEF